MSIPLATEADLIEPTPIRIKNAASMGWEYLGDGLFSRGEQLGGWTDEKWVVL